MHSFVSSSLWITKICQLGQLLYFCLIWGNVSRSWIYFLLFFWFKTIALYFKKVMKSIFYVFRRKQCLFYFNLKQPTYTYSFKFLTSTIMRRKTFFTDWCFYPSYWKRKNDIVLEFHETVQIVGWQVMAMRLFVHSPTILIMCCYNSQVTRRIF